MKKILIPILLLLFIGCIFTVRYLLWAEKEWRENCIRVITEPNGISQEQLGSGFDCIIEGPAEYQIVLDSQTQLNYGKFYCCFSNEGLGSVLETPSAAMVVLSTPADVGIIVQLNGNIEFHLDTGSVAVVINGTSTAINPKQAILVTPAGVSKNIPFNSTQFKKALDSTQETESEVDTIQ